jgi:hypothetical protein
VPKTSNRWTPEEDEYLRQNYLTCDYSEIAERLGKTTAAVRNRRFRFLPNQVSRWTDEEIGLLRAEYTGKATSDDIDLAGLCAVLGRLKSNISRKARELGLTNRSRQRKKVRLSDYKMSQDQHQRFTSVRIKEWMRENEHPRGMLGKKHTSGAIARISQTSRQQWEKLTEEERAEKSMKMHKRKIEVHGSLASNVKRGKWKAGWREIGSVNKFFRSRWEANYARYLEWLKEHNEIRDWQHEPETFWFESVKRGVRSYLPDFKVTEKNGDVVYHEVKGWMDDRSRVCIKRMAKYHPQIKLLVIDGKQYRALRAKVSTLVSGWES